MRWNGWQKKTALVIEYLLFEVGIGQFGMRSNAFVEFFPELCHTMTYSTPDDTTWFNADFPIFKLFH